jgi:ATP/ADP translocase
MKYWIYNFILIIVIFVISYNSSLNIVTEDFTPKIREMYRPVVRNARLGAEGFYNKHSSNISNLFRRFGLM